MTLGEARISELIEITGLNSPALYCALNSLKRIGLTDCRQLNLGNKRIKIWKLTPKGAKLSAQNHELI